MAAAATPTACRVPRSVASHAAFTFLRIFSSQPSVGNILARSQAAFISEGRVRGFCERLTAMSMRPTNAVVVNAGPADGIIIVAGGGVADTERRAAGD